MGRSLLDAREQVLSRVRELEQRRPPQGVANLHLPVALPADSD
jgi:hypothetical protein